MDKGVYKGIKNRIVACAFKYVKEKGRTVAPCGMKRRCKNNNRKCECWDEPDICERPMTVREKADLRLIAESMLNGWKKKNHPHRLRQMLKIWESQYRIVGKLCNGCNPPYCSMDGVDHPLCKMTSNVLADYMRGEDGEI